MNTRQRELCEPLSRPAVELVFFFRSGARDDEYEHAEDDDQFHRLILYLTRLNIASFGATGLNVRTLPTFAEKAHRPSSGVLWSLDPQYANAHHWYGDYLSIKRRHNEALAEVSRGLELDPLNLMISTWVALRHYQAGDYSRVIEQARNSVDLDPNFAAAHLLLGEGYVQAGLRSEGVSELKTAARLSGGSQLYTAQVAVALAAAGRKRETLRIARELETISRKRYVSPYGLAQIYAALKSDEDTFKWLQAAYGDRAVWMEYLAVDPIFDRHRSDQRFQQLLRRIDLL